MAVRRSGRINRLRARANYRYLALSIIDLNLFVSRNKKKMQNKIAFISS